MAVASNIVGRRIEDGKVHLRESFGVRDHLVARDPAAVDGERDAEQEASRSNDRSNVPLIMMS
jgi:hypothetical protein